MNRNIYFIIFISILFFKSSESINLINSTLTYKEANVLGVDFNYGLIEVEFDSDIFKYDSLACPNYQCTINSTMDCTCDYTDTNECPKVTGRNPLCHACPTENGNGMPYCPISNLYGNGDGYEMKWMKIEKDIEYNLSSYNKPIYLRYKADANICEGIMIQSYPIKGFHRLSVGADIDPETQRYLVKERPQVYGLINLCPTDNLITQSSKLSWTNDTYFITIAPFKVQSGLHGEFSLSFRLTSKEIPSQVIQPCTSTTTRTHKCINDGQNIIDYADTAISENKFYSFQVVKSANYTIRLPVLNTNTFLSASIENQFPTTNGFGVNASEWDSYDEFENSITIYLTAPNTLYITIMCVYSGHYSFSITSNAYYLPINISSLPPKAGAYALVKSCQLMTDRNVGHSCDAFDKCNIFSVQYPYTDNNPFNPVPSIFYTIPSIYIPKVTNLEINDTFLENPVKRKTMQLSILLQTQIGSNPPSEFITKDILQSSSIKFKSTFFDEFGNAISVFSKPTIIKRECNYNEFTKVFNAINSAEQLLYNVSNLNEMNDYEYMLDSLTIRDSWVSCKQKANSLVESKTLITIVPANTICDKVVGSKEFDSDPCCSDQFKYFQCCIPIPSRLNKTIYTQVSTDNVNAQCSSPTCTESVLNQHINSLNSLNVCKLETSKFNDMKLSVVQIARKCKEFMKPIPYCQVNSDCIEFSGNESVCDLNSRQCIPNYYFQDIKYLQCLFNQSDQVVSFKLNNNKPFIYNDTIIKDIYNRYQKDDCIIEGSPFISQRLEYIYKSNKAESFITGVGKKFYKFDSGLDDSQLLVHDLQYDLIFFDFISQPTWATLDYCSAYSFCPWSNNRDFKYGFGNSTVVNSEITKGIGDCNAIIGFCGLCSSNLTFCETFGTNDTIDQSTCETTDYCTTGFNYITSINSTKEDCEKPENGICTHNCGYKCTGNPNICAVISIKNETDCIAMGSDYDWNSTFKTCFNTNSDSINCNGTWVDCNSKPFDECAGPSIKSINYCYLQEIPCVNKTQCEEYAGECSDSYYFKPENTIGYPLNLGKCVRGHAPYRAIVSCYFNGSGLIEHDSPMGCFDHLPSVLTKVECESIGSEFSWWSPSTNKQDCFSKFGCKVYVKDDKTKMLPFNTIFNEMNEDQCIGGCKDSNNQWTNKFNWTPGKWIPSRLVRGKWYANNGGLWKSVGNRTKTLDYQRLFSDLMNAVDSQMADLIRSSYFCRNQRNKDNLNSIACSCSEDSDGGSHCFKDTALLLGQTKPCAGKPESFNFGYGFVNTTNSSVKIGCGNLLVSQFSRDIFVSTQDQSFPSNFVSYPKPDNYGLFNDKDAIVGTILSDGVTLETQDIDSVKLCFDYNGNPNEKRYPTIDFGGLDQTTKILHPMGLYTYIEKIDSKTFICSNISRFKRNDNFFPINRIDDWQKQDKSYFDRPTVTQLYALGSIFLSVSVYGFYQLIIIAIIRQKKIIHKFELAHLLILSIFIFLSIRTIYFFLLTTGKLAHSAVVDYILVVLPTFFYFSCFTIIIVLWYIVVVLVLGKNTTASNLTNKLFGLVGLVNFVIYLLLVVIILVFQYTKDKPNESCGSRIIFNVSITSTQKLVSVLYAVVQGVISLFISVAFIYLGGRLYLAMKNANNGMTPTVSNQKRADSRQRKIFLLTTVCSGGFILHFIFIIILVTLKKPNITFSFIGLIITEIIPSITILYCYDQRTSLELNSSFKSKSPNTSTNDIKLASLTTNNSSTSMCTIMEENKN